MKFLREGKMLRYLFAFDLLIASYFVSCFTIQLNVTFCIHWFYLVVGNVSLIF